MKKKNYNHLDYKTVKQLKDRIGKVICPLGVGEHFERWGYNNDRIIEMDWHENTVIDSGYDTHFADIGQQFEIDLAVLENGQYSENWKYIHMLPGDLVNAIKDLNAKRIITVHNSKYALSKHPWNEPLENISAAAEKDSLNLKTPMIGETMYLNDTAQVFQKWWRNTN